jgi:hypothetical protein
MPSKPKGASRAGSIKIPEPIVAPTTRDQPRQNPMGFAAAGIELSVLPVLASEWLMGNSYRPEGITVS